MSDLCFDAETRTAIESHCRRMAGMMARLGVETPRVSAPQAAEFLLDARFKCIACRDVAACEAWLAGTKQRDGASAFCPNWSFFDLLQKQSASGGGLQDRARQGESDAST